VTERSDPAAVQLRMAGPDDADLVAAMLVEAINWPADRDWPREEILADPRNAHYVNGWMRSTDLGVVAVGDADAGWIGSDRSGAYDHGTALGAAWLRYLPVDDPGYGFVDAETPELTIGLYPACRGRGVGRALLRRLLAEAAARGIIRISLSVEPGNRARALYESEGFVVIGTDDGGSLTMLRAAAG
jgi:ribosomal protein S18 acetylase RimI-like enzyme